MPNVDLLTTAEVAAQIERDRRTVARLVKAGKLHPAVKAPGVRGAMMFTRTEVESFQQNWQAAA